MPPTYNPACPPPGSVWRYVGPGDGRFEFQLVAYSSVREVISVNLCRSWLGPSPDFYDFFEGPFRNPPS